MKLHVVQHEPIFLQHHIAARASLDPLDAFPSVLYDTLTPDYSGRGLSLHPFGCRTLMLVLRLPLPPSESLHLLPSGGALARLTRALDIGISALKPVSLVSHHINNARIEQFNSYIYIRVLRGLGGITIAWWSTRRAATVHAKTPE